MSELAQEKDAFIAAAMAVVPQELSRRLLSAVKKSQLASGRPIDSQCVCERPTYTPSPTCTPPAPDAVRNGLSRGAVPASAARQEAGSLGAKVTDTSSPSSGADCARGAWTHAGESDRRPTAEPALGATSRCRGYVARRTSSFFGRHLLVRGPAPGPVVSLPWLSGEPVDWSVLYGGTKECSRCGRKRPSASFAAPDGNAATSAASAAVCQVCRRSEKTCVACHVDRMQLVPDLVSATRFPHRQRSRPCRDRPRQDKEADLQQLSGTRLLVCRLRAQAGKRRVHARAAGERCGCPEVSGVRWRRRDTRLALRELQRRTLAKGAFSATQLAKPASERKCHTCAERAAAAGETQELRCAGCDGERVFQRKTAGEASKCAQVSHMRRAGSRCRRDTGVALRRLRTKAGKRYS